VVSIFPHGDWTAGASQRVRGLDGLAEIITEHCYSLAVYSAPRSAAAWRGSDVVGLDFDDGRPAIAAATETAREVGIAAIIAPTKSHLREKSGKPACERFRIVVPTAGRITNARDHAATLRKLAAIFGNAHDPAAMDVARYFLPSIAIAAIIHGKAFRIVRAPPPPPPKPIPIYSDTRPPDQRWARFTEKTLREMHAGLAAGPGGRHRAVHRAIYSLAGLHAGAGYGWPSRERVYAEAFAAYVAAGEEPLVAQHAIDDAWRRGILAPFSPEERTR
jgi:hypothetical protein